MLRRLLIALPAGAGLGYAYSFAMRCTCTECMVQKFPAGPMGFGVLVGLFLVLASRHD